jgi:hypothetical protein
MKDESSDEEEKDSGYGGMKFGNSFSGKNIG